MFVFFDNFCQHVCKFSQWYTLALAEALRQLPGFFSRHTLWPITQYAHLNEWENLHLHNKLNITPTPDIMAKMIIANV